MPEALCHDNSFLPSHILAPSLTPEFLLIVSGLTLRYCLQTILMVPKTVTSTSAISTSCIRLVLPRTAPAEISTDIALMVASLILRVGGGRRKSQGELRRTLLFTLHSSNKHWLKAYSAWYYARNWES